MNATARVYPLEALIDVIGDEHAAADRARAEGRNLGPVVPFPRMADELGGHWPLGLTCMHGGPGAGKSAMTLQCLLSGECAGIFVTCEMSATTIIRRMIAYQSGQYLGRLRRGETSAAGIRAATQAIARQYPHITIIDASTAPCPDMMLRAQVERMSGCDANLFIAIDSLHSWASANDPQREEYQAVSSAVETLRRLALDKGVSILAVIERNRASMVSGGISAGAASRKIEYSAEAIIELECIDAASGAINLRFSKNRNGRAGVTIGFRFRGATQRFAEIGDPWDHSSPNTARRRNHGLDEEPKDVA